jgi:hypothetical protein
MNKFIAPLLFGLVLGGGATWLVLRHPVAPSADTPAPAAPADAGKSASGLQLSKDELASAGLQIAAPEPFSFRPEVKGYARVLDPAPLAALLTEIAADRAALQASASEYDRQKLLRAADNASARVFEAADATRIRDQSTLDAAHARLLASWGPALAARPELDSLAAALLQQQSALVRVDIPTVEPLPPAPWHLRLTPIVGGEASQDAAVLGPAPVADAQMQGPAFIALLDAPVPPPGTALLAWLRGEVPAQDGLRLPVAAVVYDAGSAFAYVQTAVDEKTGEASFERRRLELGAPLRDGVFVTGGLTAQDKVVVLGAQQLLAEEQKAAGGGGGD